ncbi:hypothetical protein LX36DRAFT_679314 [Colletotrichum falcatum]|nr:hypothetical protein LX36DRAFT_679314 [Colletotrichum falcatum]
MRCSLLFFLAPAAVLCLDYYVPVTYRAGNPATGPLCCNREGTPDPSGTCKGLGLNAYACESFRLNNAPAQDGDPDDKGGCDNGLITELFPVGRDVKGFVAESRGKIKMGPSSTNVTYWAFIGCAE